MYIYLIEGLYSENQLFIQKVSAHKT